MSVRLLDASTSWLGDMLPDGTSGGAVLAACDPPPDWDAVEQRLVDAFHVARQCAAQGTPLVYVVHSADLRGMRSVLASTLATIDGIGPLVAAEILTEVGDPARFATKDRFAMANGTAPIEASSGRVVRHRLNRGGNRQLNKALHIAAIAQISRPSTEGRRYYERCLARGKSKREALRALKRRISDRVWTHLHNDLTNAEPAPSLT